MHRPSNSQVLLLLVGVGNEVSEGKALDVNSDRRWHEEQDFVDHE